MSSLIDFLIVQIMVHINILYDEREKICSVRFRFKSSDFRMDILVNCSEADLQQMLWCYNTTFFISVISEIIPKSVSQHIFFHHQLSLLCFTTSSFSTPHFYPITQIILPLTVSLLPDTFPPSSPSLQQHDNYSKKSSVA